MQWDRDKLFWAVRVTVLLALFLGAWQLHRWSSRSDPRFYRFLTTPAGGWLAESFGWERWLPPVTLPDKPLADWTPEERRLRQELEDYLRRTMPSHRLVLADGRTLAGRLEGVSDRAVLFTETFGPSGSLTAAFPKPEVRRLADIEGELPSISYRDVTFRREFPRRHFYRRPPYTMASDEDHVAIDQTVRDLQRLHGEIIARFGPLVLTPQKDHIQVLFFAERDAYGRYIRSRGGPDGTAGFYDPREDRLAVFNQYSSVSVRQARDELDQRAGLPASQLGRARAELKAAADATTRMVVRHEGAHQLFYSLGLHSPYHLENDWLVEGLAVYCETEPIGRPHPAFLRDLHDALLRGATIPLADLVAVRGPAGLDVLGDEDRVNLAYAQAWALVYFLMQDPWREGFFRHLRNVRDPAHMHQATESNALARLCRDIGCAPTGLDAALAEHMRALWAGTPNPSAALTAR